MASDRVAARADEHERRRVRLERIRKAIDDGDYENALKLSVAADRVFERLAAERQLAGRTRADSPEARST